MCMAFQDAIRYPIIQHSQENCNVLRWCADCNQPSVDLFNNVGEKYTVDKHYNSV